MITIHYLSWETFWLHGDIFIYRCVCLSVLLLCIFITVASLSSCHSNSVNPYLRFLPNYLSTFVPIVVVMIANPILYRLAFSRVEQQIMSTRGRLVCVFVCEGCWRGSLLWFLAIGVLEMLSVCGLCVFVVLRLCVLCYRGVVCQSVCAHMTGS